MTSPVSEGAHDTTVRPLTGTRRFATLLTAGTAAVLVLTVLSILVGARALSPDQVIEALEGTGDAVVTSVVWDMRVPRTLAALVAGVALAVSGALIQALTRNPLADPGILGVNAGAAFFVTAGVGLWHISSAAAYVWLAFAGAAIATLLVYGIGSAGRGRSDPMRLVLAGVAIGAVLSGITNALTLFSPETFDKIRGWSAGAVTGVDLASLAQVSPYLLVGVVVAFAVSPRLNAIALGDDIATAQGVSILASRVWTITAITLLAGGATALCGPIAFVGLMVPHISRWLLGPDQRRIVLLSCLLGPLLLLVSDILGRVVMRPGEIPVGFVTAFVGAPALILLVRRRKASRL